MKTKDNIEILTLDQYLELKNNKFEFEGQSFLFWEYVRLLREVQAENPDVKFLLENVKMSKKWENLITSILGVSPKPINSSLVSAQERKRLYWTNIEGVTQPEDKGILLKDLIEHRVSATHILSIKAIDRIDKKQYSKPLIAPNKTGTLNTKNNSGQLSVDSGTTIIPVFFVDTDKSYCIDANYWKGSNERQYFEKSRRQIIFQEIGKEVFWRKLTPTECERLQTVPDGYTDHVSNSQRYKMLGNGWTVDVIAHIFSFLKPQINDQEEN